MNQDLTYEIEQVMPLAVESGLFVSMATILSPSVTQGPTGNTTSEFTAIDGLTDIQCMNAPLSEARISSTEMKDVSRVIAAGMRHVLLASFFPNCKEWNELGYACTVDGVLYDIIGAEADSQEIMTRLHLQRAEL
jgi:hypothetical protein